MLCEKFLEGLVGLGLQIFLDLVSNIVMDYCVRVCVRACVRLARMEVYICMVCTANQKLHVVEEIRVPVNEYSTTITSQKCEQCNLGLAIPSLVPRPKLWRRGKGLVSSERAWFH